MDDLSGAPHRRFNPLTREWVLVSPQRLARPWQGQTNESAAAPRLAYDPQCYLCPENARAGGARNPQYEQTFVFDNDFAALLPGANAPEADDGGLFRARPESGRCRVVCFSPRHDLDIAQMSESQIRAVVDVWAEQYAELGADPEISAVTIFENRGAMMGASNPHPHGQIWASASLPNELLKENASLQAYNAEHGDCLLCAYARRELATGERIVYADARVCALVPFWATWPFETLVIPLDHAGSLDALTGEDRNGLARAMREVTSRYDRLFGVPFPYSMGFHQRPSDGAAHPFWHAHAHYFPPLLRSASIRKFMVGYEMLAQPQRDTTPEQAAARLRDA